MSNGFGITTDGFVRKSLTEIKQEKDDAVRVVFGPDINLAVQSPDGQINQNSALSDDQLWQIAEETFNATDPDKTIDIGLSNLVKINAIERQEAQATSFIFVCAGTIGVTVPIPQTVSNGAELIATTLAAFTFDGSGNASVAAELNTTGDIPVGIGVMTVIETPFTGWDTVTNPAVGTEGRDRETDGELRVRRNKSTAASSQNQIEAIIGAVGNVAGVTNLTVLENDTDITDGDGVPSHSFEVIVVGGTNADVALAIWNNKPTGIQSFGTTESEVILDSQSLPHSIDFTRPAAITIFVIANLTTRPDYPLDGDDQIKQAIVDYADGTLVQGRGFDPGDDVIFTELYTPINVVPGHDIDSLFIDTTPAPAATANIVIAVREVSDFIIANITVNS